ncbi:Uma2 family endonuclease [Microcoleus asticus]|uniref:Restriction endonuclease domain-containing protein n=1 Tax=Microcoleus asticus IPMA8 TaxID=2563858 RepID=A0ABX2CX89_9CYAN|nr:Uma2 family endonuclease [Microcoleus asticus]NQE35005.1 hypothetical protein [Microcoleus asticus IPMA8]
MRAKILEEIGTLAEQRLILPGYYTWEQFEDVESLMADSPGLRITYLDGWIEFMTLGEAHETISCLLNFLLQLYFCEMGIEYIPVGSATRRDRARDVSFEPDESYYINSIDISKIVTFCGTRRS